MSEVNRIELNIEDGDKTYNLVVVKPNKLDEQMAEAEFHRVFTKIFRENGLLLDEVDNMTRKRNLWDDDCVKQEKELIDTIKGLRMDLKGRREITKEEGRSIAIEIREKFNELYILQYRKTRYEDMTAEARARDAKVNFLIHRCVKWADTGKLYYTSVDDYLTREDTVVKNKVVPAVQQLIFNIDPDANKKLPENMFLLKHGFCDNEFRLIDSQGRLVNKDYKLIDEDGRYINEEGQFVNDEGQPIDEDGDPIFDKKPLVD